MRGPLFVLVLLVPASLAAQQGTAPVRTDADAGQALFERGFRKDSATISVVEVMPAFPGGEPELYRRIKEETRYPKEALRNGITGRVMVHFMVEKDGRVDSVWVPRPVDPLLDAEAVRVVRALSGWSPGTMDGRPVRVLFRLPIAFTMDPAAAEKRRRKATRRRG
ncbi:MAG: energy transducer TonB [Flavobacteriales bacterium]|nr:energy transducer TonB [Flavobacteriales bacterium]